MTSVTTVLSRARLLRRVPATLGSVAVVLALLTTGPSSSGSMGLSQPGDQAVSATALASSPARLAVTPSAAGGLLVFERPGGEGQHIWTSDPDADPVDAGRDLSSVELPPGDVIDTDPAWSPDGRRIAFSRGPIPPDTPKIAANRKASPNAAPVPVNRDIWVMNADGTDVVNVSAALRSDPEIGANPLVEPAWSPDGRRMVASINSYSLVVFDVANPSTHQKIQLDGIRRAYAPDWSPDGTRIAFVGVRTGSFQPDHIWTMNPDGGDHRQVTPDNGESGTYQNQQPSWSPDGTQIAFSRWLSSSGTKIAVINADGTGEVRELSPAVSGGANEPVWSPDGLRIAASVYQPGSVDVDLDAPSAAPPGSPPENQYDLWVFDSADGSDARDVTLTTLNEYSPDWQPVADLDLFKYTSLDNGCGKDGCPTVTGKAVKPAKAPRPGNPAKAGTEDLPDVDARDRFSYYLDIYNAGPATAYGVEVTDTLPAQVKLVSADEGCSGSTTVTCSLPRLEAGEVVVFELVVEVDNGGCGEAANTATVDNTVVDPDTTYNTDAASVYVRCADLAVTITDNPDPVQVNDPLAYVLTVTNNGPDTASAVELVDTIAPEVDFVSVPGFCDTDGRDTSCQLGDLPAGQSTTVTITVRPRTPGEIENRAGVDSDTSDPNAENDADTERTRVQGTDVSIRVADLPDPVPYGELLTYTVTVDNHGAQATPAEVVDTLPSRVTFVDASPGCVVNGRVVRCDLGVLRPEGSATVTIAVRPFVVGEIVNRAAVLTAIRDPNPDDNLVETTTTVRGAGLAITAEAEPEPVDGNQPLTYTVTVTNGGRAAATGTAVTVSWNVPPPAATIESSRPCTVANRKLRCELGTLAAGDSVTFTVTVVPNRAGELTTTLDALTAVPDEDPGDNQVVLTSNVRPADLVLTQQVTPQPGFVGGIVTYTLRITNTGTAIARDATLIHRLPAGPQVGTVTPSAGTCVVAPVLRCELGDLAPGAAPVTVVVKVRPVATGSVVTSALATTSTTEPDLTDNEVRASTPIRQPRLELPKVGSPGFTALVVGRDFPADTDITLRWDEGLNPAAGSTTVRTDANGVFRFRMLVLPRDQIGQRNAVATGPVDSFADVTAPHLVVPNPVAPRRFISRR